MNGVVPVAPMRFTRLQSRLPLASCCVLLSAALYAAQAIAQHNTRRTAEKTASANSASSVQPSATPSARLDMLSRLQAAAVQSGDPVQIASASRELNAELLNLLSTIASGERRLTEAVDLDRESLALHLDTDLQLRLATLLARNGRIDEAVRLAREATDADPKNPRAYTTLASVLRSVQRNKEAVDPLTRALELDPNPSIAFSLGSALLAVHDKAKAQHIFQRLLAASDGAAIWHVAIGDAYREADYLSDAAAEFRAALAKDPRATHAEFFLGLVSLQLNEWGPSSESFLHLRKSVEQNPHEYLSNFYLGALESTDGSDLASSDRHLHTAAEADPNQPEVWIYLGQNAQREHRNADAITYLRKAVQLTGSDEARNHYQIRRAYFSLGRLLIATGKRDEGEKYLADYKRTGVDDAAAATAAIAQKQSQAASTLDGKQAESSLQQLSQTAATQQASTLAVSGGSATDTATVSPQLRSAEAQLRTMLSSGFNDLGTAEARQQQYGPALHDFQQAERFGGESPALLHNIAIAAYRINDSAEVQRALTEYFGSTPAPNDPRARLMLAMASFDLGRFGEAARSFKAAGDATMGDARTVYTYAFSLARDGQAQEATALADRLMTAGLPPDRLALVCNVYFTAENYAGSERCYREVVQQDPSLRTAHYFVGESLIHLDRPSDAIPQLQQELALTPGEPNVESSLAFALAQTGHKAEAQAMLERTVAAHPDAAEAQYQLGKLLTEQGKNAEAIPHLEASVSRDASKDYAHYQLATAYRKAGRTADAEREFTAYRQIKDKHRNDRAVPQAAASQSSVIQPAQP